MIIYDTSYNMSRVFNFKLLDETQIDSYYHSELGNLYIRDRIRGITVYNSDFKQVFQI